MLTACAYACFHIAMSLTCTFLGKSKAVDLNGANQANPGRCSRKGGHRSRKGTVPQQVMHTLVFCSTFTCRTPSSNLCCLVYRPCPHPQHNSLPVVWQFSFILTYNDETPKRDWPSCRRRSLKLDLLRCCNSTARQRNQG